MLRIDLIGILTPAILPLYLPILKILAPVLEKKCVADIRVRRRNHRQEIGNERRAGREAKSWVDGGSVRASTPRILAAIFLLIPDIAEKVTDAPVNLEVLPHPDPVISVVKDDHQHSRLLYPHFTFLVTLF